jgi:hypothetical protein
LAAQKPSAPPAPVTSISALNVKITWGASSDNGSPITGYTIYIKKYGSDDFAIESTNCHGADETIRTSRTCYVPINILRGSTYNHPWGASIYAKVIAYNVYGLSDESAVGNGAVILTVPDAPLNVVEVVTSRAATSITISWQPPPTNGGAPVIDYTIISDDSVGVDRVIKTGESSTSYQATGLTAGKTYTFKVEARNKYGNSLPSLPVSILCAGSPEAPLAPTTVNFNDQVIISWQAPPDNGEPLLGYFIYLRKTDGEYELETDHCDGSDQDIILALSCTIPLTVLRQSPFAL